ncbi:probable cation transporter HKT1;4 [Typha latifolia]|uniref:probable cation transporter HKT1;4 n=1 Tax=Typha latifolia TaxID=4733 RepID=UPI003C2FE573
MACFYSLSVAFTRYEIFTDQFTRLRKSLECNLASMYRYVVAHSNPLCIHIIYFLSISSLGFLLLKSLPLKPVPSENPKILDVFFTAVSAATVSSMSTVEMEVFSPSQLLVLIILMLIGGEVFTSLLGLQFRKPRLLTSDQQEVELESQEHIELQSIAVSHLDTIDFDVASTKKLKYNAVTYLAYVILGYMAVIHVAGSISIFAYIYLVSSGRSVLMEKGIQAPMFAVFTTVSSFSSCGFIPTNENMMVFKKNSGLLLLIIPQALLGNTLYPSCLRLVIWVMRRVTGRVEFEYILKNSREIGYYHLLSCMHSILLAFTIGVLLMGSMLLTCAMEWNSKALQGLSSYQKVINSLFVAVNARHTGESTLDLSQLNSAILVLFVLMMYLPPYTTFMPFEEEKSSPRDHSVGKRGISLMRSALLSQLSYLAIFVILICITEKDKLREDSLNFSVFNIIIEVVSAYGNVGFSTGYSCSRQLNQDKFCRDAWYGFAGRWSSKGKIILIFVMFFGRLKKYSMGGGAAWNLS